MRKVADRGLDTALGTTLAIQANSRPPRGIPHERYLHDRRPDLAGKAKDIVRDVKAKASDLTDGVTRAAKDNASQLGDAALEWPTAPRTRSKPRCRSGSRWAPITSARSRRRPAARRTNSKPNCPRPRIHPSGLGADPGRRRHRPRARRARTGRRGPGIRAAAADAVLRWRGRVGLRCAAFPEEHGAEGRQRSTDRARRIRRAARRVVTMALSERPQFDPASCSAMPSSSLASSCRTKRNSRAPNFAKDDPSRHRRGLCGRRRHPLHPGAGGSAHRSRAVADATRACRPSSPISPPPPAAL